MLGNKIKELRGEISQDSLSKKLHISRAAVSLWESGKRTPDINMICRIADCFKVSVDFLVEHENNLAKQEDKLINIIDLSKKTEQFRLLYKIIEYFNDSKLNLLTGYAVRLAQE